MGHNDYTDAVQVIKTAILRSQYKAAKSVNAESLSLNYGIGQYVSKNSREGFWGTGAIETISEQLHKELPGLRGFSSANIKFMRQFYEEWNECINSLTTVSEFNSDKSLTAVSEIDTHQLININNGRDGKFNFDDFLSLGFTHHMIILRKTKTLSERLFYIQQAAENKWNKGILTAQIESNLFEKRGSLPNNFTKAISEPKQALKAIQMFKDEYLLDFINVEELGVRDKADIDEKVIEQEIVQNVKNFIMTFGHDFTFVGNQYHLEIYGEEQYPDLLFFNRELNALVVVELKKGNFKTAYLGQLCAYLRIIDDKVKKPHENPTIGLILCKTVNKEFAEYVIQDYDKPMGIATYKSAEDMPEKLRKALPDVEKLKELL